MRIAVGLLASAVVLFASGAANLIGTWGLVTGTVLTVASAIAAVVAMEERDRVATDRPVEAAFVTTRR